MRTHETPRRLAAVVLLLTLAAGCAAPSARLVQARLSLQPASLDDLTGIGLAGFRGPAKWEQVGGLYLLEPYRRGAIPVVLTHGLFSDPGTWERMHRKLRADPHIASRYQFWTFAYPTGPSYLNAAADLRDELSRVRRGLDPAGTDAALSQAVLIGHSMGGIVSRLQVVDSGEVLWRALAHNAARLDDFEAEARHEIERILLFRPQPGITRVIYIAAPHGGSPEARGRLAQLGRRLVLFPEQMTRGYNALRTSPAGRMLRLPASPPTSVELLDPCHPILRAVRSLPTSPLVRTHTILGTGEDTAGCDGDGYVGVCSATLPDALTTFRYPAAHTDVHRKDPAINEVRRILLNHLQLTAAADTDATRPSSLAANSVRSEISVPTSSR